LWRKCGLIRVVDTLTRHRDNCEHTRENARSSKTSPSPRNRDFFTSETYSPPFPLAELCFHRQQMVVVPESRGYTSKLSAFNTRDGYSSREEFEGGLALNVASSSTAHLGEIAREGKLELFDDEPQVSQFSDAIQEYPRIICCRWKDCEKTLGSLSLLKRVSPFRGLHACPI
jgi:hypothetical protein